MSLLDASQSNPREGGASFSLKNRLLRLAWGCVWGLLGRWTPRPMHKWRRFLLNCFGAQIHAKAKVYPGVEVWYPPHLKMAAYSCLAQKVNCYCMAPVELGEYALISQGAYLCGGTHDINDPFFQLQVAPIVIGKNGWIAAEAFVGPGVHVGEGAVLGARGVRVKDMQEWKIYAGNPAREIGERSKYDSDKK